MSNQYWAILAIEDAQARLDVALGHIRNGVDKDPASDEDPASSREAMARHIAHARYAYLKVDIKTSDAEQLLALLALAGRLREFAAELRRALSEGAP